MSSYGIFYGTGRYSGQDFADAVLAATFGASNVGRYWIINDDKDNETFLEGLARDSTVASVCRFRLLCKLGKWTLDPTVGSRLHTIKSIRRGRENAEAYIKEALQPLINEGLILSVQVGDIRAHQVSGKLSIGVLITLPDLNQLDLGLISVGA